MQKEDTFVETAEKQTNFENIRWLEVTFNEDENKCKSLKTFIENGRVESANLINEYKDINHRDIATFSRNDLVKLRAILNTLLADPELFLQAEKSVVLQTDTLLVLEHDDFSVFSRKCKDKPRANLPQTEQDLVNEFHNWVHAIDKDQRSDADAAVKNFFDEKGYDAPESWVYRLNQYATKFYFEIPDYSAYTDEEYLKCCECYLFKKGSCDFLIRRNLMQLCTKELV